MIDIASIIGDHALRNDATKLANPKQGDTTPLINKTQEGDQLTAEQLNILITALQRTAGSFIVDPRAGKSKS